MKGLRSLPLWLLIAAFLSACSRQAPQDEPAQAETIPTYSAAQFFETTSYGLVPAGGKAFSQDGTAVLMNSDKSGVFNAYALSVSDGEPTQLTNSTDNAIFGVSWFPDDNRILYTYDSGGNELNHVVVREVDGLNRDLTPGDELKARFLGWSDDGRSFYLLTTERNQRSFDVYRYATSDYSRELVFENPGLSVISISGDERWLALNKPRTSADSDVYIVDLQSDDKEPMLITEHDGNIAHGVMGFTPDSRYLNYSTNEFGEFNQAWQYDLETGQKSLLAKADWDVWYVSFSPGGKYRVSGVNADASTEVTLTDLSTGEDFELPGLPPGDLNNIRFSADDSLVALIVNADNSPSNIHVVDLEAATSRQLTDALNPAIDPSHLVSNSVVRYESFDDLEIPGILYRPHNSSADNPAPAPSRPRPWPPRLAGRIQPVRARPRPRQPSSLAERAGVELQCAGAPAPALQDFDDPAPSFEGCER